MKIAARIALNGMKGRRKDTFLLFLVVVLSFMFAVSSTLFYAGIAGTETENRLATYGEWQAAYLGADTAASEYFAGIPEIDRIARLRIINGNTNAGTLGTMDEALLSMGCLTLQGRLPEADDEIALEESALAGMGLTASSIGSEVLIEAQMVVATASGEEVEAYRAQRYEQLGSLDWLQEMTRNLNIPETRDDGVEVILRQSYLCLHDGQGIAPEDVAKEGVLTQSLLIVRQKFTLVGVVSAFCDTWDVGGYQLPKAYVTPAAGEAHIAILNATELTAGGAEVAQLYADSTHLFLYSSEKGADLYDWLLPQVTQYWSARMESGEQVETSDLTDTEGGGSDWRLHRNSLAYPLTDDSRKTVLIHTVLGVIFVASALSVFQIYLTQVRRRARSIALMKAVGADNRQICLIFGWEALFLLAVGLPIGIGLGAAFSLGAAAIGRSAGGLLSVGLDPGLTGLGVAACVLSLAVGVTVPMLYAVSIPLTGTVSRPQKHSARRDRESAFTGGDPHKTALRWLRTAHGRANRVRTALTGLLSVLGCVLLAAAVALGHVCHKTYNETVLLTGRPDFVVETLYAFDPYDTRYLKSARSDFRYCKGVSRITTLSKGNQLHLYYEGIDDDPLITAFRDSLPSALYDEHFGGSYKTGDERVDGALLTTFYGLNPYDTADQSAYDTLLGAVTDGTVDRKAFDEGEEVILLLPMYAELDDPTEVTLSQVLDDSSFQSRMSAVLELAGRYRLSLRADEADGMTENDAIAVGDTISLAVNQEVLKNEIKYDRFEPMEVRVGGIIRYFPDEAVWPFAETAQGYAVVGSVDLMRQLYVGMQGTVAQGLTPQAVRLLNQTQARVKLGRTVFYLYADATADAAQLRAEVTALAEEKGYLLTSYLESNRLLLAQARSNSAIVGLLGVTSALLAVIILYNTLSSRADQERTRTGILQAIGVRGRTLRRDRLRAGFRAGLISAAVSTAGLAAVYLVTAALQAARESLSFSAALGIVSFGFPTALFAAAMLLYWAVVIWIYYAPFRGMLRSSPVENIRSAL